MEPMMKYAVVTSSATVKNMAAISAADIADFLPW